MRPLPVLVGAALLSVWSPLQAQEFPAPVGRKVYVTGTFNGSVTGTHTDTLYNGDIVTEQVNCSMKVRFLPNGTATYTAGNYLYEKFYYKKTTTGGYLVAHKRMEGMGIPTPKTGRGRLWVEATQYGDIWNAGWNPVDQPSEVLEESWLTDGLGRTWGHSTPLQTRPMVYCEPRILWRGKNGDEPGLKPQDSYSGPHVFWRWATVTANWNINLPR
jgi:hypothetical protein